MPALEQNMQPSSPVSHQSFPEGRCAFQEPIPDDIPASEFSSRTQSESGMQVDENRIDGVIGRAIAGDLLDINDIGRCVQELSQQLDIHRREQANALSNLREELLAATELQVKDSLKKFMVELLGATELQVKDSLKNIEERLNSCTQFASKEKHAREVATQGLFHLQGFCRRFEERHSRELASFNDRLRDLEERYGSVDIRCETLEARALDEKLEDLLDDFDETSRTLCVDSVIKPRSPRGSPDKPGCRLSDKSADLDALASLAAKVQSADYEALEGLAAKASEMAEAFEQIAISEASTKSSLSAALTKTSASAAQEQVMSLEGPQKCDGDAKALPRKACDSPLPSPSDSPLLSPSNRALVPKPRCLLQKASSVQSVLTDRKCLQVSDSSLEVKQQPFSARGLQSNRVPLLQASEIAKAAAKDTGALRRIASPSDSPSQSTRTSVTSCAVTSSPAASASGSARVVPSSPTASPSGSARVILGSPSLQQQRVKVQPPLSRGVSPAQHSASVAVMSMPSTARYTSTTL